MIPLSGLGETFIRVSGYVPGAVESTYCCDPFVQTSLFRMRGILQVGKRAAFSSITSFVQHMFEYAMLIPHPDHSGNLHRKPVYEPLTLAFRSIRLESSRASQAFEPKLPCENRIFTSVEGYRWVKQPCMLGFPSVNPPPHANWKRVFHFSCEKVRYRYVGSGQHLLRLHIYPLRRCWLN